MKMRIILMLLCLILISGFMSCKQKESFDKSKGKASQGILKKQKQKKKQQVQIINPKGMKVKSRFFPPLGYVRKEAGKSTFTNYLRDLPLKKHKSFVSYHDGTTKDPGNVYLAVVDMEIGEKNLQQCADAVMRLRGEYLYSQKKYNSIRFNFLKDGRPRYYKHYADKKRSYKSFRKYMDYVFEFANTRSLAKELKKVKKMSDILAGDVFIQTGNPYGHAVIVMDVAEHKVSQEKIFLLAQSFMPAQDIQILHNPMDKKKKINPWYKANIKGKLLITPQWVFKKTDLKRFK